MKADKQQKVIYRLHSNKSSKIIYVRSLILLQEHQYIEHPSGIYAVDDWDYNELVKNGNIVIDCREEDDANVYINPKDKLQMKPIVYVIEDKIRNTIKSIEENFVVLNEKFDSVYGKCKIYNRANGYKNDTLAIFARRI